MNLNEKLDLNVSLENFKLTDDPSMFATPARNITTGILTMMGLNNVLVTQSKIYNEIIYYIQVFMYKKRESKFHEVSVLEVIESLESNDDLKTNFRTDFIKNYLMYEGMVESLESVVTEDRCIGVFDNYTGITRMYPTQGMEAVYDLLRNQGAFPSRYLIFTDGLDVADYDLMQDSLIPVVLIINREMAIRLK